MLATLSERLLAADELDDEDRRRLLRTALRLRHGGATLLLAGRHVAIAADAFSTPAQDVFERAAAQLGARVSRIAPDLLRHDGAPTRDAAARLLPRLYDAIDCHLGEASHALALQRLTGVPVYLALADARHPIRALLVDMPGDDVDAALTSLVQAVLVETLG